MLLSGVFETWMSDAFAVQNILCILISFGILIDHETSFCASAFPVGICFETLTLLQPWMELLPVYLKSLTQLESK